MKTNSKKYEKKCPSCGEIQEYKNKSSLTRGVKNNVMCRKCMSGNPERRKKISKSLIGNSRPIEVREKIRNTLTGRKRPKSVCEKLKLINLGRTASKETRKKMSESHTGRVHTESAIRQWRISAIERISNAKFNGNQMVPGYNPSSISIIEQKAKELGITDLQHAENGGEYHIKELGYFVDGYSKEKNIVIEYYEKFHKRQTKKDKQRQKEILEFLNCEFIIIKEN